jgi:hypothetical protein
MTPEPRLTLFERLMVAGGMVVGLAIGVTFAAWFAYWLSPR